MTPHVTPLTPLDKGVPWTSSSAPALRPQRADEAVRQQTAQALFPTGTPEAWALLTHALGEGGVDAWDPWRADRWLRRQADLLPLAVRDALHMKGERVWRAIHAHLEQEWVTRQGLQPQRQLGDPVDVTVRGEKLAGVVVARDTERGYYTVRLNAWCEAIPETLGHVGVMLPWEAVDPLVPAPSAWRLRAPPQCQCVARTG
jgi:hypothetical protein